LVTLCSFQFFETGSLVSGDGKDISLADKKPHSTNHQRLSSGIDGRRGPEGEPGMSDFDADSISGKNMNSSLNIRIIYRLNLVHLEKGL